MVKVDPAVSDETVPQNVLEAAPMAFDRSAGWRYFRDRGDVFEDDGTWYITSTELIRSMERNTEVFSNREAFGALGSPVPLIPLAVDPPEHARYRRILDPMFAPRVINRLEDDLRGRARALVDAFAERGTCDVIQELAVPYPTEIFMTMFGLPLEDRDKFVHWVETIMEVSGHEQTAAEVEASHELNTYLKEIITWKKTEPGEDVLSAIVTRQGDEAWTDLEILGTAQLMVTAGLDTVTASIGFTMMHLAQNPDLRRRMVADLDLVVPIIEEVLRLELSAPLVPRKTTREIELGGVRIPAGARCIMAFGAANRGPEWGPSADEIDLSLAGRPHLTFGSGVHRCLGSHLARRELRLVVEEFHKRIPEYSMPEGFQPQIVWPTPLGFHLTELPLAFTPRSADA